jgi:hypothetical protein
MPTITAPTAARTPKPRVYALPVVRPVPPRPAATGHRTW